MSDPAQPSQPGSDVRGRRPTRLLRNIAVVVLLVLGTLVALAAPPAVWGRNQVLDTDRYVRTLGPLAEDPGVQAGVIKAIDAQFNSNLDIKGLTEQVLPPRASILAGPLASATQSLVDSVVTRFVQGPEFVRLWDTINRLAHTAIDDILTGKSSSEDVVQVRNGRVLLDLAPIVSRVKSQLVAVGLTVASQVPVVGVTIEIAQIKGLEKAQQFTQFLNAAANWLPWLALALLVGAVLVSRRRRRTVIIAASCVAGAMVALGLALVIGRSVYLSQLPGTYLSADTSGRIFDTVLRYLRYGLRAVLVAALLVIVVAWFTGPSPSMRRLRHGISAVPSRLSSGGLQLPMGDVVAANRRAASVGVLAVAGLVIVLWSNPSLAVVVTIVVIAAILLLLVRAARLTPEAPDATETPAPPEAAPAEAARPK